MVAPGGFDAIVSAASRKYGVPESVIRSVMRVESGNRADALGPVTRSGERAGGYMQIMPKTYAEVAAREGLGSDRMDPTNNIFAGTAYLGDMHKQFGNWGDAFGAYNSGPGRWAKVKAGASNAPAETTDYVQKVLAGFGQPEQVPARDVAMVPAPQAVNEGANMPSFSFGAPQQQRVGSLTGLLEPDDDKNFYEGLGGIWNVGQTPSQPPAIDAVAMPGSTQTDRLGVGSRMNDLVQQLLAQSPQRGPAVSPLQYQLAGAGQAVGQLAGVRDRKVGIGELLGALGGGLTRGQLAGDQAQQAQRADQFKELGALGDLDYRQRTAALNEQNSVYDNQFKQAQTLKALRPETLETTPAVRNALAMGLRPGTPEFNDFVMKAGLPANTQVSVGAQEKAEDKAYGEELVKDYATVRDTANAGRQSLQAIEIARNIPVTTGAIEPLRAKVGALAQSFGISPEALRGFGLDQATTAEAFTGVMQNLVLSRMQAQKGPQTQQDAQRIESTVASLGNTPEASDFLLRTGQAMARRDVEKHNFYEQYRASKGSLNGVQQAWDQELSGRPLLGVNPNSRLPVFYDEFVPAFLQANPGATKADALTMWKSKYGQ